MQGDDIAFFKELALVLCRGVTVRACPGPRLLARPHEHLHSKRLAVARDHPPNALVAKDSQRLSSKAVPNAALPFPCPESLHLLRNLPHRRENQPPGQLRR